MLRVTRRGLGNLLRTGGTECADAASNHVTRSIGHRLRDEEWMVTSSVRAVARARVARRKSVMR